MREYLYSLIFVSLTFFLSPLFLLICFLRRNGCRKILVIQTAKVGDLICSTPVFREIKKHYPQSFLSVLIIPRTKGILINNPHVDEIILLDREKYPGFRGILKLIGQIKNGHFDWSFSLLPGILNNLIPLWSGIPNRVGTTSKYTTRGAKLLSIFNNYQLEYQRHTLTLRHYLNLLRFININKVSQKKEIFIKPNEEKKALQFSKKHNLKPDDFLIGISLTAGNKFKEWSLEKFVQLADRLVKELGAKIIFVGASQDGTIIDQAQSRMTQGSINASQFFSLAEAPALFKYFKIFISVDSGSLYIANALDVPVVDIAGPIDIYEQPPLGDKCVIVQKKIECLPCSFAIPPARICHNKEKLKCLKLITVDDVYQAVKKGLTLAKV